MDKENVRRIHRILLAILVLSFLIRGVLIFSGGQYFWPDEYRYQRSMVAANALWGGDIYGALRALHSADHFLFKVIGVVPATIGLIVSPSPKIPALFFSLFSIANLWLLWGIMRRTGENERASLFAVSLLALCSTFLYYCRHLLPYDVAMAFGLGALFVGLRTPIRAADSILCGLFSACTFLTYNGYWVLAGFAMLAHTLRLPRSFDLCSRRAYFAGVAFTIPFVVILAASDLAGGDLLKQFYRFSHSVTQGAFSEGWSLPLAFLWHAEHLLVLLWAVALIYCLMELVLGRRKDAMILGVLGIIFIYGILAGFSTALERFVVYGRLVRQLVPFFCILAALSLDRLWTSAPQGKSIVAGLLVLAVLQAAVNLRQPFAQVFPNEFDRRAAKASEVNGAGEYEVLFDHIIFPEPEPVKELGRTIIQERHPLQYLPYQYEGYTPDQRSKLRSVDISMRLILKGER